MSAERGYCSEHSLAAAEPMAGTADQVDLWILLEYRSTWTAKVTTDNALAPTTREWLARLSSDARQLGLKPRLQFIRQPEIERTGVTLFVAADGVLRRIDAPDYAALSVTSLATVLNAQSVDPQYFVCTNGQRDLCCARFGLPVYTALRERVGARVWQTTHVGGHRFAANVLTLPQGALYGRLQPGDMDELITAVETNRLAPRWLRGRSRYSAEVQAAEASFAARGIDTSAALSRVACGDGSYRIGFGGNVVTVRPGPAYDMSTSCDGGEVKSITPWLVDAP